MLSWFATLSSFLTKVSEKFMMKSADCCITKQLHLRHLGYHLSICSTVHKINKLLSCVPLYKACGLRTLAGLGLQARVALFRSTVPRLSDSHNSAHTYTTQAHFLRVCFEEVAAVFDNGRLGPFMTEVPLSTWKFWMWHYGPYAENKNAPPTYSIKVKHCLKCWRVTSLLLLSDTCWWRMTIVEWLTAV